MLWAVWPVAVLFASLWLPVIGKRIALAFWTTSTAVTGGLPTLVAQLIHGAPDISGPLEVVHRGDGRPGRFERVWELVGWLGVVWLVLTLALALLIAVQAARGASAIGLVNALVLLIGWPICYWTAFYVMSHSARG
jgi:hypothetical protein